MAIALRRERSHTQENTAEVRIDKWLWAARFLKTRSLASDALAGGKVALNGARPKPSGTIRPGDYLNIGRGVYEWIVIVKGTATYRGAASDAQRLYEETEVSRSRTQAALAQLNSSGQTFPATGGPCKKARRAISKFTNRRWQNLTPGTNRWFAGFIDTK